MKRYLLRQRFFKITDHFDIKDDQENVCFVVRSKLFTIGKKFWIDDTGGQELLFIKQRIFSILGRFDLYQGENYIGKIKRRFTFFTKKLSVTSNLGNFKVKGNVFAWNFKILDDAGNLTANISKSILKIADTYTVDAYSNDLLVVAIGVTLDSMFHPRH